MMDVYHECKWTFCHEYKYIYVYSQFTTENGLVGQDGGQRTVQNPELKNVVAKKDGCVLISCYCDGGRGM